MLLCKSGKNNNYKIKTVGKINFLSVKICQNLKKRYLLLND